MNRREALKTAAASVAALGIPATVDAIDSEPKPICLCLKIRTPANQEEAFAIEDAVKVVQEKTGIPTFALTEDVSLEAVRRPE